MKDLMSNLPKDFTKMKSSALLHKMSSPPGGFNSFSATEKNATTVAQSEWEGFAEGVDPKRRQSIEVWRRNITVMNDMDDKADVREGIAETKGVRRLANEEFKASLGIVPFEQNTKVYKMLKQQRDFMKK